jgi:hypothetical protein
MWVLATGAACAGGAGRGPDWAARIDRAEAKWKGRAIDDYRIVVRVSNSLWHLQTHDIEVRDGAAISSSATCIPAPTEGRECTVRDFDPDDYTVTGLFAKARWIAERGEPEYTGIEFDRRRGYPTLIRYDHPEMLDEDWAWSVEGFEEVE